MLEVQAKLFEYFLRAVDNNKLSHAYLFDVNNNSDYFQIIVNICKMIFCENDKYFCDNCNICKRIEHNNFPDLMFIRPDGTYIKKEQIMELQDNFSKTSIESKKRVYIIFECEKMNKSTSNSLLKFLEEPCDNVIAFLVTNNINSLLDTIKSRCQVMKLVYNNNSLSSIDKILKLKTINDFSVANIDSSKEYVVNCLELIKMYESRGLDILINFDKILNVKKTSRDDIIFLYDIFVNFYYDVLLYKNSIDLKMFSDYKDLVSFVSEKNSVDKLLNKIRILLEYKEYIKFNVNIGLLFDSLFINFEGDNYECSGY